MEYSTTIISSIEYPDNMSLVIFLAKCPLRCPYCSNNTILEGGFEISLQEIKKKINNAVFLIDAVVISGGEPLVQVNDVIEIFKYAKNLNLKTKLDTSGIYPDKLKKILDLKLIDYIAMDIKAPFNKYQEVIKSNVGSQVRESMKLINKYNIVLECRTTYCPAILNIKDLFKIASEINCDIYTLQQFKNKYVLDQSLVDSEEPDPRHMEDIAINIKELYPNRIVNIKTIEFGQKVIDIKK